MKINEVEQLLDISKANIRFYEKQGLLTPVRLDNKYREYYEADIERLKSIIILRKLGIPVQEIGKILQGDLAFQDAIEENITNLEAQMAQLQGALNLSKQILQERQETLDTNRYWEIIRQKEAQGETFADIVAEYWSSIGYPLLAKRFGLANHMSVGKKICTVLSACLCYGIATALWSQDGNFWLHLLHWPIVIAVGTAITFLIFWIGKHHPKIGAFLNTLLAIICVIFLGGVCLLLIGGGLVALWNWIF